MAHPLCFAKGDATTSATGAERTQECSQVADPADPTDSLQTFLQSKEAQKLREACTVVGVTCSNTEDPRFPMMAYISTVGRTGHSPAVPFPKKPKLVSTKSVNPMIQEVYQAKVRRLGSQRETETLTGNSLVSRSKKELELVV